MRAVFLDRDGVLNEEVGHLSRPNDLRLLPGVSKAIKRLNDHEIPVVVVTNQSAVARGICTEKQVSDIHAHLAELLTEEGASITRFCYCPHHPTAGIGEYRVACDCRKPKPGMLFHAAGELNLDLTHSVMVGDLITDLEAGWAAGCRTVLISTGHGREAIQQLPSNSRQPDYVGEGLPDAIDWILRNLKND